MPNSSSLLSGRFKRQGLNFSTWALRLLLCISALLCISHSAFSQPPGWWSDFGVLDPASAPDDYAAANIGQAKFIASKARDYLETTLPGGAGAAVHTMVDAWATPAPEADDFAALNLGQLKHLAAPFYERLIATGDADSYPWSDAGADDYAIANIGQLKNLFAFASAHEVLAHWPLNEPSGTIASDIGPLEIDGTLAGGATRATGRHGVIPAVELNGIDGHVNFGSPVDSSFDFGQGSFTLALWVQFTQTATAQGHWGRRILSKGYHQWDPGYFIGIRGSGRIEAGVGSSITNDPSEALLFKTIAEFDDGEWHHIALVIDAVNTEARLYVNGIAQPLLLESGTGGTLSGDHDEIVDFSALANLSASRPEDSLTAGSHRGLYDFFEGRIDDIRIYAHPLTAPQVAVLNSADQDGNGLPDWWEILYFEQTGIDPEGDPDGDKVSNLDEYLNGTDPLSNEDTDSDGMPDDWEVAHGLNPLNPADPLDDADGDRVPNLWEYVHGTDPNDAQSTPASTQVVAASGGTHTALQAAYNAASDLAIIEVKSGSYSGQLNAAGTKRVAWLAELAGPNGPVVLERNANTDTVVLHATSVMDGFIITHAPGSVGRGVYATKQWNLTHMPHIRLVNCMIRGNTASSGAAVYNNNAKLELLHCTIIENQSTGSNALIYNAITSVTTSLINSILWSAGQSAPELRIGSYQYPVTNSIIRGGQHGGIDQNPTLAYGGWMTAISPACHAGGPSVIAYDIHGEPRPSGSAPDLGWDEFHDANSNGIPGWLEALGITDPNADHDSDGLSNLDEFQTYGTNLFDPDTDGDGLSDGDEVLIHGTDPLNTDTDGDGMPDGYEVTHGLDPLVDDSNADLDGDGLSNFWEFTHGFDPSDPSDVSRDTSESGIPDWWEITHFGAFGNVDASADPDGDGLTNLQEYQAGTDPNNWDTDGDLLPDGWEVQYGLDPLDASGNNGADGDPDDDGLSNFQEMIHGTNPLLADTDGDGVNDGDEVNQGSNPNDAGDGGHPPPPDEIVEVPFTVGDPSGSHSERWEMSIQANGPDDTRKFDFVSPDFGEMSPPTNFKLRRGNTYTITISHVATNRESGPDYDWQAQVDSKPTTTVLAGGATHSGANRIAIIKDAWILDNEQGLLGLVNQSFGSTNHATGKSATLLPFEISSDFAANKLHVPEFGKMDPYDPSEHQPLPVVDEQKPYETQNSLVIHHKDVRKLDGEPGEIIDFDVDLKFAPGSTIIVAWSKFDGPESGTLVNANTTEAIYRNPKKGGLYKLDLTALNETTRAQIWLPKAGPDISSYWQSEIDYFKSTWGPAYRSKLNGMTIFLITKPVTRQLVKHALALKDMADIGNNLDWMNPGAGTGQVVTTDTSPLGGPPNKSGQEWRYTIEGYVIDFRKRNNMMYALIGREMSLLEIELRNGPDALGAGTPDSPAARAAYEAGFDLYKGKSLEQTMRDRAYSMQEPDSWAEREWPSEETTSQGLKRKAEAQLNQLIQ